MALTPEEKAERARQRMIDKAKEYQLGTYIRKFVAPVFQSMIRAEYAAERTGFAYAIVNGSIQRVNRDIGECACITCGIVAPWKGNSMGGGLIESGHFIASRRQSIVFEENNCHPQCKHCNRHLSGNQGCYELWMRHMFGQEEIDRLRRLKTESISFSRDELVDMRIEFELRLKDAEERMAE